MKILWFTLTPCGATQKLVSGSASCGWLSALENQLKIQADIELHVAFYYKEKIDDFVFQGVHYHPIYDDRYASKLKILIGNYREYFHGFRNHDLVIPERLIHKIQPDLIHYHGTEADFGLLQQKITKIPSVVSIQGVLNSCYEKLYSGVGRSIISSKETLWQKLILKTAKMDEKCFQAGAIREREILRLSHHVIGRTEYDRHAAMGMSSQIHYYVGDEILRDEFYHARWNPTSFHDTFTIATTISSGFYKGLEVILRTAINLKRAGFKFRWIVIGQDDSCRDVKVIRKWLGEDYADNNIHLVGRKSAAEVVTILQSADIYCQTSHIENSPNSVCEAMMLGMPVVASFAGGTSSMLEHGKEGYLLQDGDSCVLAGTLIDVANHFDEAKKWGDAARQRALLRHDPMRIVQQYVDIYKQIIENPAG